MSTKTYINIEVEGVNGWDAPDFVDAYISYAEHEDGTPCTEDELNDLTDTGLAQEMAYENLSSKAVHRA